MSGSPVPAQFYNTGNGGVSNATGSRFNLNGVVIGIPEPATMGLLALGGVSALFRRRRR